MLGLHSQASEKLRKGKNDQPVAFMQREQLLDPYGSGPQSLQPLKNPDCTFRV